MTTLFEEYVSERLATEDRRRLEEAIWAGDVDTLDEIAGCRCCCWEHTFEWCPARMWGGCRGQGNTALNHREIESWKRHYMQFHGMTEAQFYGVEASE